MIGVVGVDEVWRWSWAGPIVAWACFFIPQKKKKLEIISYLKDSKKLSKKNRELLYNQLLSLENKSECFLWIGIKWSEIIDQVWIKKANKLAMIDAINEVINKIEKNSKINISNIKLKIDGNDKYIFEWIPFNSEFIIKWDNLVDEIKAASIFAKVTRDKIMSDYSKLFPWYKFEKNVWYGTRDHINWLSNIWICPIHRKSYAPIKNII